MNTKKLIIVIGSVIALLLSIYMYDIQNRLTQKLTITEQKIDGLNIIDRIHNLDIALKHKRGISQFNEVSEALNNSLYVSDNYILTNLRQLHDNEVNSMFKSLSTTDKLSKTQQFEKYTQILKVLDNDSKNIAESSNLLYESQKDINILISIAILNVSNALEEIGQLRGNITRILNLKKGDTEDLYTIKSNLSSFVQSIENIKFLMNHLPSKQKDIFIHLIDEAMGDYNEMYKIVHNIENATCKIAPEEFFLKATNFLNDVNTIYFISKDTILSKLRERQAQINDKKISHIVTYLIIILLTLSVTFYSYYKVDLEGRLILKRKDEEDFIKMLHANYAQSFTLKDICKNSLQQLISKFGALDGSLYLYDEENKKLYLGAVYGVSSKKIKNTLSLDENRLSENILEKKMNIIDVTLDVNVGNHNLNITKIVTMPILEFGKSVGAIQLSFDENFKNLDINYLQNVINLMGNYILKTQVDSDERNYLALIDSNILMSRTDLNGTITEVSSEFCHLSQYSREEILGKSHSLFKHDDMSWEVFVELWQEIKRGNVFRGEIQNRKKDGSTFWTDIMITPNKDINGNIIGYIAIRQDITDRKKVEAIAITDGLTTLFNRRHFDTVFPQQIGITKRKKGLLAFMLIDIDHFKQYNDTYGHQAGDRALKLVAKTLKSTLHRANDFAFRLGGEEFGLLYHIENEEDSLNIANRARKKIENLYIEHRKNSASKYLTISAGLYVIKENDINNEDEIYHKSDEALYIAKEGGRNQVRVYST